MDGLGSNPLVPSGRYMVIYDLNGYAKVLETPVGKNVLVFDGTDILFVDGSAGKPFSLPNMELLAFNGIDSLVGMTNSGTMFKFEAPADADPAAQYYLTSYDGVISFTQLQATGVPATGYGLVKRSYYSDPLAVPGPSFLNSPGIVQITQDGDPTVVTGGTNGQHLVLVNQIPTWVNQPSGSVSAGTASTGLDGVIATNGASTHAIQVQAAAMTLNDGAGATFLALNVNVTVDTENLPTVGPGGFDNTVENANKWYYVYVISDGTNVAGIISENGTAPSFANAPGYTKYALASVFRNNGSSNIVNFAQRGRKFWTVAVDMSNPCGITESYNPITQGVPLTTLVPPNVKTVSGIVGGSYAQNEGLNVFTWLASNADELGKQALPHAVNLPVREGFVMNYTSFYNLLILDPVNPQIFWRGSQVSSKRRVVINGYEI